MKTRQFLKTAAACASLAAMAVGLSAFADGKGETEESLAIKGFKVAPVPLNMMGKNPQLVGYGSYLVNVLSECNGCHSAGPQTEYAAGGNPYFAQKPAITNPATYLGGSRDFGQLIPGTANIVSRNLTPDKTGLPVGGMKFEDFRTIFRTGADLDKLHPNCTAGPNPGCLLQPFDGSLLQIMPWPTYSKMTDREIRAIYEYLSAVPCIGGPAAPSPLHNECK